MDYNNIYDSSDEDWNPRKFALQAGLLNDDQQEEKDPLRFANSLGLTDSEKQYQNPRQFASAAGLFDQPKQENYLDDNLGNVTRSLPIDQPNGSIVSGGREDLYHKYSQMLEQEPDSTRLLSDYMGRMPTHAGFVPSGQDKLTAAVMGGIAGLNKGGLAGIGTSQQWLDKPFRDSQEDWKGGLPLVELQARQSDNARNRQAQGILATIRQQEVDRENRRKDELTGILRGAQQQNARTNAQKATDAVSEKNYTHDLDERKFGETQRHNKSVESRLLESLHFRENTPGKASAPKSLSPEQQIAQRKLNAQKIMTSDPGFAAAYTRSGAEPEKFYDDNVTDPQLADQRRKLAVFQTIMQMLDQRGGQ